ncbi:tetratricopeptide repeat protein [Glycomyces mayteni]|uniref:non-specific serine/threonine protein kinase n=1 Tax=Glycomyces mayteni TaxID=543887 RepID=A0ABW2DCE9_9ACTN|nr:serine/threonine-protein kinase [Glycomyces mayteni]
MTEHCERPDCRGGGTGVYDDDGYCNRCNYHRDDPVTPVPAEPDHPFPPVEGSKGFETVFIDPVLPDSQRRCRNHHRVGFTSDGRSAPLVGTCEECEEPYDFTNHLNAGDVVAAQYEVKGCIAHGGFGGIYVAHDRHLDKEVVLKGLLNQTDPEAQAIVEAERRYLVTVKHPNIIDIHNSVKHRFPDGAEYDYLVMDYVRGLSLADRYHPARLGRRAVAPIAASGFGLQILDAFAYLHGYQLVYCDLKPGNVIQSDGQLTIIDLGAMRRLGLVGGPVYGSPGFQAPEVFTGHMPDVVSDLYTFGRTLAVLALGFPAAELVDGEVRETPLPDQPPLFNDSLYLLLQRACDHDRDVRFTTAEELADQLGGVLRQLQADASMDPVPVPSNRFGVERGAFAAGLASRTDTVFEAALGAEARTVLPVPLADRADPAYTALAAIAMQPADRAIELAESLPESKESRLALLRMAIESDAPEADRLLEDAADRFGGDWRIDWYRGVRELGRDPEAAAAHFGRVRSHLPGELAPMLALAVCAELAAGPAPTAAVSNLYDQVRRTDPTYTSAAFGVARCSGDRAVRIAALEGVPAASSQYRAAQQALLVERVRRDPDKDAVLAAGANLDRLDGLDSFQADLARAELWRAALAVIGPGAEEPRRRIDGVPLTRDAMASEYERVLRRIAKGCKSPLTRWALVTEANRNRPRTWL